jgi:hypothetical protein
MLKKEVVQAVKDGKFGVLAVSTADEAITVMTGIPAGTRQDDGTWPEGTFNFLVDRNLREMARKQKAEDKGEKDRDREEKKKDENNDELKKEPERKAGAENGLF